MKYLKSFEKKYEELLNIDFVKILKENCKNFSFDNDPLYRGDDGVKGDLLLHNVVERGDRGITFVDFFKEKEKDTKKYPIIRNKSAIGMGGGTPQQMIGTCKIIAGKYSEDENEDINCKMFRVIPFDDSKMVFAPTFDTKMLEFAGGVDDDAISDDHFLMAEYTKNFKVPVEELKKMQKEIFGKYVRPDKGFEFFMSSPCLLINIENESLLKQFLK